jgi:hypothetical protein
VLPAEAMPLYPRDGAVEAILGDWQFCCRRSLATRFHVTPPLKRLIMGSQGGLLSIPDWPSSLSIGLQYSGIQIPLSVAHVGSSELVKGGSQGPRPASVVERQLPSCRDLKLRYGGREAADNPGEMDSRRVLLERERR